jgi:hypothetical protein
MFYLYVNKYVAHNSRLWKLFSTSNYQYILFSKKNPITGFSAYPDVSPSQLIQMDKCNSTAPSFSIASDTVV